MPRVTRHFRPKPQGGKNEVGGISNTVGLVAIKNNEVIAWAALTPVSGRCVYVGVAEVSVYVSSAQRGKGIGKMLLEQLIPESERNNIWTLQAGIFLENESSLRIHAKGGFSENRIARENRENERSLARYCFARKA